MKYHIGFWKQDYFGSDYNVKITKSPKLICKFDYNDYNQMFNDILFGDLQKYFKAADYIYINRIGEDD